jgi:hypothetical protein
MSSASSSSSMAAAAAAADASTKRVRDAGEDADALLFNDRDLEKFKKKDESTDPRLKASAIAKRLDDKETSVNEFLGLLVRIQGFSAKHRFHTIHECVGQLRSKGRPTELTQAKADVLFDRVQGSTLVQIIGALSIDHVKRTDRNTRWGDPDVPRNLEELTDVLEFTCGRLLDRLSPEDLDRCSFDSFIAAAKAHDGMSHTVLDMPGEDLRREYDKEFYESQLREGTSESFMKGFEKPFALKAVWDAVIEKHRGGSSSNKKQRTNGRLRLKLEQQQADDLEALEGLRARVRTEKLSQTELKALVAQMSAAATRLTQAQDVIDNIPVAYNVGISASYYNPHMPGDNVVDVVVPVDLDDMGKRDQLPGYPEADAAFAAWLKANPEYTVVPGPSGQRKRVELSKDDDLQTGYVSGVIATSI